MRTEFPSLHATGIRSRQVPIEMKTHGRAPAVAGGKKIASGLGTSVAVKPPEIFQDRVTPDFVKIII